jgi:hypothetical protein
MNTTTITTEFAMYCNECVEVLEVDCGEYGNLALISFDCGREDWVPLATLDFLN